MSGKDPFDERRGREERVGNAGAQWFHISGEVDVFDVGAATANIVFDVQFAEKPKFSFGSELAPGGEIDTGNMPTCLVTVLSWDQRYRDDSTAIYVGATLCIVTTGPADQNMTAFWHMEGVGLRGPATAT